MLSNLRPRFQGLIDAMAAPLIKLGITPLTITIAGLLVASAGAALVATGRLVAGAIVYTLGSCFDFLDGTVARNTGTAGPTGSLLDSVLDRYGDFVVLLGIGLWLDTTLGWALAILALQASLLISYVRAKGESLGVQGPWPDLMERPERIALLAIAILAQGLLPTRPVLLVALGLLVLLGHVTVLQRTRRAYVGVRVP